MNRFPGADPTCSMNATDNLVVLAEETLHYTKTHKVCLDLEKGGKKSITDKKESETLYKYSKLEHDGILES